MKNQKLTDPRTRAKIRAATVPQRTWWPELAGALLLIVAILESTKAFA